MPFNGAGVYTPPGADFPVVTNTVISSTHFNNTINDIATALSLCITKDGQQAVTANIPFNGFRVTNVGVTAINGSVGTPAINVGDAGTGLYRSALNELAVTVNGTQRGRFDATGLIVTGTVNASTSVVTPLVASGSAVNLGLGFNGVTQMNISSGSILPASDNAISLGVNTLRWSQLYTPIIDSGTPGSLSLRTNNGSTQVLIQNLANDRSITLVGGTSASGVHGTVGVTGGGTLSFVSDSSGSPVTTLQTLYVAGATRNVTIAPSNGGNPTLSTTAGSLAITPAVVIAGASLSVGTTPALTGVLAIPANSPINGRNVANTGDVNIASVTFINAIDNLVKIGDNGNGVLIRSRSAAGAPLSADIPAGLWTLWRDTAGATTKLYYNNGGALQSVALA